MISNRFHLSRVLIALTVAFAVLPVPALTMQDSGESQREREARREAEFDQTIQALIGAARALESALEELSAGYEAEMRCPNGTVFLRERQWDSETLRATPVRSLELDMREQCGAPQGLPDSEVEWWYSPANQTYACSGPFGNEMSRWSDNYEFLQEACVIHDICYRSTMEKDTCDSLFQENMLTLCQNPGLADWLVSGICEAAVEITAEMFEHQGFSGAYEIGQTELQRRLGKRS